MRTVATLHRSTERSILHHPTLHRLVPPAAIVGAVLALAAGRAGLVLLLVGLGALLLTRQPEPVLVEMRSLRPIEDLPRRRGTRRSPRSRRS